MGVTLGSDQTKLKPCPTASWGITKKADLANLRQTRLGSCFPYFTDCCFQTTCTGVYKEGKTHTVKNEFLDFLFITLINELIKCNNDELNVCNEVCVY